MTYKSPLLAAAFAATLLGALSAAPALADDGFMTAQAGAQALIARADVTAQAGGIPPGHPTPRVPRFVNFQTGANVKAMAMKGRDLWLGMPNGLIRYNVDSYDDHEIFTVASTRATDAVGNPVVGLPVNGIYALDLAPDGALWISTYGGGLTRFDGKNWKTYSPVEGLGDRWAYDVEFHPDGSMWVATWKGASVLRDGEFKTYTEADGVIDKWVYDVAIDPEGKVWLGTEGGVSVWDGETFTSYTHADGLGADIPESERKQVIKANSRHHQTQGKANQGYNPNYVLAIAVAPDGAKWIGTWGAGLSRFDGKTWKTYTTRDGLGGNFIHALKMDDDGVLWAATDGGISFLKGGVWNTLNSSHGLIDDNVFSILFEQDGTRWFGTWTGLSKLPPARALDPNTLPKSPHGAPATHPAG